MPVSLLDVLGPVMTGPSSSHTAGAARLARVAALIAGRPFFKVRFGMSGSFAMTGLGHGTYEALLAGALGLREDDEHIRDAHKLAEQQGLKVEYREQDMDDMHENSVCITFFHEGGGETQVWGSSTGGGRILITRIGSFEVGLTAECPTLVVHHQDRPGVVSEISGVLARQGLNIAVMRLSRQGRGKAATVVIELDEIAPEGTVEELRSLQHVNEVLVLAL